ncbi:MAG: hypothetical protein SFU99_13565 [Saprospiraceae bacterium]|nr:hypothetical protein [Saprospiraceae bacterium]
MKRYILLVISLFCTLLLSSQSRYDGLWEGELTYGGIYSEQSYRFQMWLEADGGDIKGRSYVFLSEDKVIEMEIRGRLYSDLSIYLLDTAFVPAAGSELVPSFYRKYQLLFKRSIWETALEGYWQEIIDSPLDEHREKGRIKVQRVKTLKP